MSCNLFLIFGCFRYTDGLKDIDPDQVALVGASSISSKEIKDLVKLCLFLEKKDSIVFLSLIRVMNSAGWRNL